MISQCNICKLQGDKTEKECTVLIFPSHYAQDHSILCVEHEEGMRKMIGDRETMFKELMKHSVRCPDLEIGLDPIYTCQSCNRRFSSPDSQRYCSECRHKISP